MVDCTKLADYKTELALLEQARLASWTGTRVRRVEHEDSSEVEYAVMTETDKLQQKARIDELSNWIAECEGNTLKTASRGSFGVRY